MEKKNHPTWLLAILPICVGVISIYGWICGDSSLIAFTPNAPIVQPLSAVLAIVFGIISFSFGFRHLPYVRTSFTCISILLIITSICILVIQFLGLDYIAVNVVKRMGLSLHDDLIIIISPIVWYCWAILSIILLLLTAKKSRAAVIMGESLTFILLFLALIGFISSTSQFEILYIWLNSFSMPIGTSLSFISFSIILTSYWSHTRRYQSYFSGYEDKKIVTSSGALLIQSAVTAGLICFTTLARQNEAFLKNSLEQYIAFKANVLTTAIDNEIAEIEGFKKFKALPSFFTSKNNTAAKDDIKTYFRAQQIEAWQIIKANGAIIMEAGQLHPDPSSMITLPNTDNVSLINHKNWSLAFNIPISQNNKTLGYIKLEHNLEILNKIFWLEKNLSSTEELTICSPENSAHLRCFSSLTNKKSYLIDITQSTRENTTLKSVIENKTPAFLIKKEDHGNFISTILATPKYNLLIILNIDTDEIYTDVINQFKNTLPILFWFILFSVIMLKWQVIPLLRKVRVSEKDAVDNARLLTENEARLRAIVDNIGESILVVDERAIIESMNITACEMFECDPSTTIGSPISTLLNINPNSPDLPNTISDYVAANDWQEISATTKDNRQFYAEFHITEIKVRQKKSFIVIIRDVTEQKLAGDRVKESERLFRSSFDYAPIGMALIGTERSFLQVNQSLCKMLGYPEQEMTIKSFDEILSRKHSELFTVQTQPLFEDKVRHLELKTEFVHHDGYPVTVNVNLSVMTDSNDIPIYIIAQVQDITDQEHFEQDLKSANEELKQRYNETALSAEMSSILQSCLSTTEALEPIEKYAKKIFKNTCGILYLYQENTIQLFPKVTWGDPQDKNSFIARTDCWALRRGQVYSITNTTTEICCHHTQGYQDKVSSSLCIPLSAQGETIGLLYFENYATGENVTEESIVNIKHSAISFADQVSLALANINLRETLHHQSIHDSLTSLYNRRYLDETLKLELLRSIRKNAPLSILMIDIDHFKLFNDNHGHEAGDLILQEMSNIIRYQIRDSDVACRMGGEEFLIILPDTPVETAYKRAENLRAAVSEIKINIGPVTLQDVTISVGIASYPDHAAQATNLLEAADKALYRAKKLGRNQVSIFASKANES